MSADLKPYPVYKHSGIEWLGEVPERWEVKRGKALFRCVNVRSSNGEETLLTVSSERGVVPRSSATVTMFKAESYVGYKLCWPGDLVINSLWAWGRGLGVSRHHGIISSAYGVYRLRPPYTEYSAYVHALVRSTPFNWELQVRSKGIWISRLQLTDEAFLGAPVPLPPLSEQAAIVRFLDHADRRIQRYIRAKEKLIALLEEQKQAIIHRAVTRGLDPNVRLKPSGVECLGDIPEHWKTLPLKRWVSTKITDGPHETPALLADGIPFLSAESMVGGSLDFSRRRGFISSEQHEVYCRKCHPRRDDIFMCKSGATTGKVAMVETADEFSVWSPLALIRVESHKVLARLLFAVLQTRYVQRQVQDTWSYGTQPNLAMRAMERLVVVLPPLDEQQKVLAHLDRATKKPSEDIDRAQREIVLLREYRTRLIADVVTGKFDVREAAARLPDEVEELEPLDETDALIDGEDEPTDALATAP